MVRVTGLGGIFFKSGDPKALSEWYRRVLGFAVEDRGGALFRSDNNSSPHIVWAPFAADSGYFAPSARECMINFAVDDLDGIIARLAGHDVAILGREDNDRNGRFAWFVDPAGFKIELWEPKR